MSEVNLKRVVIYFIIILVISIGSNAFIYYQLKSDFNSISSELYSTREALNTAIDQEHNYNVQQREVLRNETIDSLDRVNRETSRLKTNINSQIGQISNNVQGLEGRIEEISVSSSDFTSIIEDIAKAVVSIRTDKSQGSGFFFDSRGYIITNKHVVDDASAIQVIDYYSRIYSVEVIGYSTNSDLAVLKITSGDNFDYLEFADPSTIDVGSRVIAVGNPLGLTFSVTEGIISGTNRRVDNTDIGYIQTDVSINRGNSGGPLVNSAKKVVGVNTFKIIDTEGIGFAIPSSVAKNIAEEAINNQA